MIIDVNKSISVSIYLMEISGVSTVSIWFSFKVVIRSLRCIEWNADRDVKRDLRFRVDEVFRLILPSIRWSLEELLYSFLPFNESFFSKLKCEISLIKDVSCLNEVAHMNSRAAKIFKMDAPSTDAEVLSWIL